MTFLVTFTFDVDLIFEMLAVLDQLAYMLITTIMKSIISIILETCTFCIGGNGHVKDEYLPDEIGENWFYPNLTIYITVIPEKLDHSELLVNTFRDILQKQIYFL